MKNKEDKYTYMILWLVLCVLVMLVSFMQKSGWIGNQTKSDISEISKVELSEDDKNEIKKPNNENDKMIGVWISYLSLGGTSGEADFKDNFDKLVEDAKKIYATDLFVHTRAFSDALYESDYFPWSHLITGTQGQDPEFDPLEYMIDKTHSEGMKFHAWINPLRVSLETVPSSFSSDNIYSQWSESKPYYFIEKDSKIILNPAYKEVRTLVANGAVEIVENYDVDGIHFDDYFYPDGILDEDNIAYQNYVENTENPLSLEEWRLTNINAMILQTSREIKAVDSEVLFGISPQANFSNNFSMGADVTEWMSVKGYIDYIIPQIYFSYDNPSLGFAESLEQWVNAAKHDELKLYVGLAGYKASSDSDEGTWLGKDNILANEVKDSISSGANGVVLYDVRSISDENAKSEIENLIKQLKIIS